MRVGGVVYLICLAHGPIAVLLELFRRRLESLYLPAPLGARVAQLTDAV
jgi:hypothetical protein